ncbi:50S ribosomal protein L23 [Candidatus Woesearchaeota archaeon]|nr:50S ribosomal protein L23 [Candidatus Woesearchaeota archaeon]
MDPYNFIKHPVSTEKAIRMMESENKLVFVVDNNADKPDIRKAVESMFGVKVTQVNVYHSPKGKKLAYVKLDASSPALDVATQLGLI